MTRTDRNTRPPTNRNDKLLYLADVTFYDTHERLIDAATVAAAQAIVDILREGDNVTGPRDLAALYCAVADQLADLAHHLERGA